MRKILVLLALVALCVLPAVAGAQTVIAVDISKATFSWNWTRGTQAGVNDGVPTEWWFSCGATAGAPGAVPVKVPYVAPGSGNAYSQAIKPVIGGSGAYYCSLAASNTFGVSPRSNEVQFSAGTVPVAATGLVIQAQ
jgi:hypothetical protein